MSDLERIASLSQRIGLLEAENWKLKYQVEEWAGKHSDPIDHAQWTIQTLLEYLNDADAYLLDIDEVADHLVDALGKLGSVRYGMAYSSED